MDCEYHFALTQRAKQDVRQNVGYIRNELGNEKAAGMLMNELDKCIERLCIFPESGKLVFDEYLPGIPFFVDGVIEHGRGMGHKVLLPTTNIVPAKEKLMPPNGVYDTVSHFKDRTLCGITNVGYKPTIGEKFLGVETYLFDCEEDLYGEPCRVEFFHYSRPEKRFSSIEALKQQLLKDAEKGKAYFRSLEK